MTETFLTCESCGWYSSESEADPDTIDLMECPECGSIITYER